MSTPAVHHPPVVRERLPVDATAPGRARRAVERLRHPAGGEVMERVKLLVSELVTNSVCHARLGPGQAVELTAALAAGSVRVEVCDRGPGFTVPPAAAPDDVHGRGLVLVDGLADRWGVAHGERTTVWFEIDAA